MVGIMENSKNDHIMSRVRGALKRASHEMLSTILEDERCREAFEAAVIKVATSTIVVQAITKRLAQDEKIMAPIAKFVPTQAKKGAIEDAEQSVILASLPLPPYSEDSSSADDKWKLKRS